MFTVYFLVTFCFQSFALEPKKVPETSKPHTVESATNESNKVAEPSQPPYCAETALKYHSFGEKGVWREIFPLLENGYQMTLFSSHITSHGTTYSKPHESTIPPEKLPAPMLYNDALRNTRALAVKLLRCSHDSKFSKTLLEALGKDPYLGKLPENMKLHVSDILLSLAPLTVVEDMGVRKALADQIAAVGNDCKKGPKVTPVLEPKVRAFFETANKKLEAQLKNLSKFPPEMVIKYRKEEKIPEQTPTDEQIVRAAYCKYSKDFYKAEVCDSGPGLAMQMSSGYLRSFHSNMLQFLFGLETGTHLRNYITVTEESPSPQPLNISSELSLVLECNSLREEDRKSCRELADIFKKDVDEAIQCPQKLENVHNLSNFNEELGKAPVAVRDHVRRQFKAKWARLSAAKGSEKDWFARAALESRLERALLALEPDLMDQGRGYFGTLALLDAEQQLSEGSAPKTKKRMDQWDKIIHGAANSLLGSERRVEILTMPELYQDFLALLTDGQTPEQDDKDPQLVPDIVTRILDPNLQHGVLSEISNLLIEGAPEFVNGAPKLTPPKDAKGHTIHIRDLADPSKAERDSTWRDWEAVTHWAQAELKKMETSGKDPHQDKAFMRQRHALMALIAAGKNYRDSIAALAVLGDEKDMLSSERKILNKLLISPLARQKALEHISKTLLEGEAPLKRPSHNGTLVDISQLETLPLEKRETVSQWAKNHLMALKINDPNVQKKADALTALILLTDYKGHHSIPPYPDEKEMSLTEYVVNTVDLEAQAKGPHTLEDERLFSLVRGTVDKTGQGIPLHIRPMLYGLGRSHRLKLEHLFNQLPRDEKWASELISEILNSPPPSNPNDDLDQVFVRLEGETTSIGAQLAHAIDYHSKSRDKDFYDYVGSHLENRDSNQLEKRLVMEFLKHGDLSEENNQDILEYLRSSKYKMMAIGDIRKEFSADDISAALLAMDENKELTERQGELLTKLFRAASTHAQADLRYKAAVEYYIAASNRSTKFQEDGKTHEFVTPDNLLGRYPEAEALKKRAQSDANFHAMVRHAFNNPKVDELPDTGPYDPKKDYLKFRSSGAIEELEQKKRELKDLEQLHADRVVGRLLESNSLRHRMANDEGLRENEAGQREVLSKASAEWSHQTKSDREARSKLLDEILALEEKISYSKRHDYVDHEYQRAAEEFLLANVEELIRTGQLPEPKPGDLNALVESYNSHKKYARYYERILGGAGTHEAARDHLHQAELLRDRAIEKMQGFKRAREQVADLGKALHGSSPLGSQPERSFNESILASQTNPNGRIHKELVDDLIAERKIPSDSGYMPPDVLQRTLESAYGSRQKELQAENKEKKDLEKRLSGFGIRVKDNVELDYSQAKLFLPEPNTEEQRLKRTAEIQDLLTRYSAFLPGHNMAGRPNEWEKLRAHLVFQHGVTLGANYLAISDNAKAPTLAKITNKGSEGNPKYQIEFLSYEKEKGTVQDLVKSMEDRLDQDPKLMESKDFYPNKALKYLWGWGYGRSAQHWAFGYPIEEQVGPEQFYRIRNGNLTSPEDEAYYKNRDEMIRLQTEIDKRGYSPVFTYRQGEKELPLDSKMLQTRTRLSHALTLGIGSEQKEIDDASTTENVAIIAGILAGGYAAAGVELPALPAWAARAYQGYRMSRLGRGAAQLGQIAYRNGFTREWALQSAREIGRRGVMGTKMTTLGFGISSTAEYGMSAYENHHYETLDRNENGIPDWKEIRNQWERGEITSLGNFLPPSIDRNLNGIPDRVEGIGGLGIVNALPDFHEFVDANIKSSATFMMAGVMGKPLEYFTQMGQWANTLAMGAGTILNEKLIYPHFSMSRSLFDSAARQPEADKPWKWVFIDAARNMVYTVPLDDKAAKGVMKVSDRLSKFAQANRNANFGKLASILSHPAARSAGGIGTAYLFNALMSCGVAIWQHNNDFMGTKNKSEEEKKADRAEEDTKQGEKPQTWADLAKYRRDGGAEGGYLMMSTGRRSRSEIEACLLGLLEGIPGDVMASIGSFRTATAEVVGDQLTSGRQTLETLSRGKAYNQELALAIQEVKGKAPITPQTLSRLNSLANSEPIPSSRTELIQAIDRVKQSYSPQELEKNRALLLSKLRVLKNVQAQKLEWRTWLWKWKFGTDPSQLSLALRNLRPGYELDLNNPDQRRLLSDIENGAQIGDKPYRLAPTLNDPRFGTLTDEIRNRSFFHDRRTLSTVTDIVRNESSVREYLAGTGSIPFNQLMALPGVRYHFDDLSGRSLDLRRNPTAPLTQTQKEHRRILKDVANRYGLRNSELANFAVFVKQHPGITLARLARMYRLANPL